MLDPWLEMLMVISFDGKNQREDEFGSYDTEGHRVPPRNPRVLGYWDLQVFQLYIISNKIAMDEKERVQRVPNTTLTVPTESPITRHTKQYEYCSELSAPRSWIVIFFPYGVAGGAGHLLFFWTRPPGLQI